MKRTNLGKQVDKNTVNTEIANLEEIALKVAEIKDEQRKAIEAIRDGLTDTVVVFFDLVDSTKFKIDHKDHPEKWIVRLKQFGDVVKEYIEHCGGIVVKYIGDELMAVFNSESKVSDALNCVGRIKEIEKDLLDISGHKTFIKIAMDYGQVFMLKYEGHDEPDPQGTPIDRCARISKYCEPGVILSSYGLVSKSQFPNQWLKIGQVEMKGLGKQPIYQFGDNTVEIVESVVIPKAQLVKLENELDELKELNQEMNLEHKEMVSTISELQSQIKNLGNTPIIEKSFETDDDKYESDYSGLKQRFRSIKKEISKAGVSNNEYARFLFLYQQGVGDKYDVFKGREFDSSIEKKLVYDVTDEGYFELNTDNKRNQKILEMIHETEGILNNFIDEHGVLDEEDLFEYSFSDPDFWENYIDIDVT